MWPDLDYFATLLVLLQAFLLYGIAVRAEALDGPRLLRAAKAAAKKAAEKRTQRAGERVVPLGAEMDAHRRAKLDRVRAAYAEVGSLSDDYWEPFLVRFLVEANWDEAAAMTKLLEAAPWRRDHGAAAIRRKFAGGFKLGEHPKFVRMLSTVSVLPAHAVIYLLKTLREPRAIRRRPKPEPRAAPAGGAWPTTASTPAGRCGRLRGAAVTNEESETVLRDLADTLNVSPEQRLAVTEDGDPCNLLSFQGLLVLQFCDLGLLLSLQVMQIILILLALTNAERFLPPHLDHFAADSLQFRHNKRIHRKGTGHLIVVSFRLGQFCARFDKSSPSTAHLAPTSITSVIKCCRYVCGYVCRYVPGAAFSTQKLQGSRHELGKLLGELALRVSSHSSVRAARHELTRECS